ncbi:MAG: acyl-CoA dehydrogenase [Paracoccaceae bacterium]|nr:acyl-CoA dehydrogenase [Paracoccaceae bacterium]
MDFNLSDERRMLQETARRMIRETYPIEKRHDFARSEKGFSADIWRDFAELGLVGALLPAQAGGYGGTGEDIALVFEEVGRGLVVEPFLATAILGAWPLCEAGGAEAGDAGTLEAVIEGRHLLALAHGEPGSRYSLAQVKTQATESGGIWRISGVKSVVLNGDTADDLIVSARIAGAAEAQDGLALFRVDPKDEGVARRSYALIDGGAAADITLGEAIGTPIGAPGEAYPVIERTIARAALAAAAQALGAMEAAKDLTLDFLKTRTQFGKPIGANQVLQHRMVDMLIEIEQLRSCVMLAASTLEAGRETRERNVSAAKHLAGRVGRQVAEEVIQMHGGVGMTWELAAPHYAKRIVMIDHLFGDTDHHLERFIHFSKGAA